MHGRLAVYNHIMDQTHLHSDYKHDNIRNVHNVRNGPNHPKVRKQR